MKRQSGAIVACGAFFLHVLNVDFGYIVVHNPLINVYPWPSIVLLRRSLASFADAR